MARDREISWRIPLLLAVLWLPAVAGAAPFSVTYAISGGQGFGRGGFYQGNNIQSGTIVVTFPNPGSGSPPLASVGHSIYVNFLTTIGGFTKTFAAPLFSTGVAFRGAAKTLTATRSRVFEICPSCGPGHRRFRLRASSNGQITYGLYSAWATPEDTHVGFSGITGQEVAAMPEPKTAPLVAIGGLLLVGAAAVRRLAVRRRLARVNS